MKFYKVMFILGIISCIIGIITGVLLGKDTVIIFFSIGLICYLIGIVLTNDRFVNVLVNVLSKRREKKDERNNIRISKTDY